MGADGNVMGFLYVNRDKQVKVRYSGDRDYSFVMAASDMEALVNIYELSQVLSAMQQIKKEQEEANMKIAFINKRINDKQPQGEDAAK
jgi:ArsR family metal-binding transcriptional regulator